MRLAFSTCPRCVDTGDLFCVWTRNHIVYFCPNCTFKQVFFFTRPAICQRR
jgi:hypothetical protein